VLESKLSLTNSSENHLSSSVSETFLAVLMRTPGDEAQLALGFALTEGIVLNPDEVASVRLVEGSAEGDRYDINLAQGVVVDPEQFRRNLYTSSSCGVCGKASIDAVRVTARTLPPGPRISEAKLTSLPYSMRQAQPMFDRTGAIHAAAAFTPTGNSGESRKTWDATTRSTNSSELSHARCGLSPISFLWYLEDSASKWCRRLLLLACR